ncbi:MAG TPA: hypothetical protein VGF21_06325 [Thermoleophilaceae bacterium]
MRRLVLALASLLATAWLLPAGAQAANLYVNSGADSTNPSNSIAGLIQLSDGGGEFRAATTSGNAITGTGGGPIVANSGGGGSVKQFSGGAYHALATGVGTITSMTVTGRGLVVAKANKLQYLIGGHLSDVPHGTIGDGPWISITTEPNGLLLGWAWHGGIGRLYELNLGSGAVTTQDFSTVNSPLANNCNSIGDCGVAPIPNAGGISADGQGGVWVAGVGADGSNAQLYYAPPTTGNFSFNAFTTTGWHRPHVSATGDGKAYFSSSDYDVGPGYISFVDKFTPAGDQGEITTGKLRNSALFDLAVDRCYTFCSVSGPSLPGGGGGGGSTSKKPKLTAPKKTVKLGKKGLKLKLKCSAACTVTVTGSLSFGKAKRKKKASSAASNKIKKAKFKLKKGKSKTVTVKLSKSQRKKVKKALHKHRKVTAKLKLTVKSKGLKTLTKRLKLRVK